MTAPHEPTAIDRGRSSRPGGRGLVLSILVAAVLPILLWPPLSQALDGSFDSSWRWAVNQAAALDLTPGVLSAGPLAGLVESRVVADGGLLAAAVFQVAYRALWIFALVGVARARPNGGRWVGAGLLLLFATLIGSRWPDYDLVLLILVLLGPWLAGDGPDGSRLLLAGALTGLAPWLKLSAGIEAVALVGVGWLLRGLVGRGRPAIALIYLASGFAVATAIAARVVFDSRTAFLGWLRAIGEVLGGYGAARALELPGWSGPVAAAVPALLICAGAGWALWSRSATRWLWLAAVLPTLAALKHGLVRPDLHALAAPWWAAGVLAVVALFASTRRQAAVALALGAVVVATAAPLSRAILRPGLTDLAALASGVRGVRNLAGTVAFRAREEVLSYSTTLLLEPYRRSLGPVREASRGGVDVVPWRLTVLAANGLERAWVPSPTFQFSQASTARLAERVESHFAAASAPEWLLVHFDPMAGRQPIWEVPRAWREIAARYSMRTAAGDLLVLRRRERPWEWRRRPAGTTRLDFWQWRDLPAIEEGESLAVEIELQATPIGRWRSRLYRAEPVWIETDGPGGRSRWRFVPDFGRQGLTLSAAPGDLAQLSDWLRGRPVRTVDRIRLLSTDADRYRTVSARWLAERLVAPAGDDPPGCDGDGTVGTGCGGPESDPWIFGDGFELGSPDRWSGAAD